MLLCLAILVSLAGPTTAAESLESRLVGHGCCSAEHPPTLGATLTGPKGRGTAGQVTVRFSGSGAPPAETGWLLAGPRPIASHALGNGGFLHLDPAAIGMLRPIDVEAGGTWTSDVVLPVALLRPEFHFTVQAAFRDPGMSIDFALSDAIAVTLEVSEGVLAAQ